MSTSIEAPQTPQPASSAEAIQAWADTLPQVYQTQLEYAPKQAQQQVEIAQQYALPLGQAYYEAQKAMYPETVALQEQLANQAAEGMNSEVPDWMRQEYLSNLNASLGTNVGAPIAADYTSRGLLEQKKGWQDYYRNLGLSVANRQPLTQATSPGYSDYMSNYTPSASMNYQAQTYAPYVSSYSNMYSTNAQQGNPYLSAGAGVLGSALGGMTGGMFGLGGSMAQQLPGVR